MKPFGPAMRYGKVSELRSIRTVKYGAPPSSKKEKTIFVQIKGGDVVKLRLKESTGGEHIQCVRNLIRNNKSEKYFPSKLIHAVRAGLPVQELKDMQVSLDVPMERLGAMLGLSKATLHRRRSGGRLGSTESDRIVRFARLMGKAVEVMESNENARKWLNSPQVGLGGAMPLDYAETEVGAREVEDLLGRIEHGVYS